MLQATQNGAPNRCAENLLKIRKGEVPFERLKGVDGELIDRPLTPDVKKALHQSAKWNIETYEPRLTASDIAFQTETEGDQAITIQVKGGERSE